MSKKIYGVTVGTPLSPAKIAEKLKPVKTVNGIAPDENGNVEVQGGSADAVLYTKQTLTANQKAQARDNIGITGTGKDGVSVTHKWNGTVLSVTSASGTSSADLKGDDGITPHIGSNGNWWIGNTDTGVSAGGSGGGGGATPDWNAADGEPGHVLNRTHYYDFVPVLEETTISYTEYGVTLSKNLNLVVGQVYTVFWNGVKYVCTAIENAGRIGLGDLSVADESVAPTTGEPFVIGEIPGSLPVVVTSENVTRITLSIYHHRMHKLDNHYLDMSWIPSKVGEVILPEQICNGSLKAIDAKYRVDGTPIIAFVDGIPHESVITVDGVDTFANLYFGVNSMVSLLFTDTATNIWGDYLKGRSVKICLREYNKIPEEHLPAKQPLTFTGAVSATYDGSEAVSIEIPAGGGGGGSGEVMEVVADFTIEEEVKKYTFICSGKKYKRLICHAHLIGTTSNSAAAMAYMNFNYDSVYIDYGRTVWFSRVASVDKTANAREIVVFIELFDDRALYSMSWDTHANHDYGGVLGETTQNTAIDTITLTTQNGGCFFGIGTSLKVWGVLA